MAKTKLLSQRQKDAIVLETRLVHLRNEQFIIAEKLDDFGGVNGLQETLHTIPMVQRLSFDVSEIEELDLSFVERYRKDRESSHPGLEIETG